VVGGVDLETVLVEVEDILVEMEKLVLDFEEVIRQMVTALVETCRADQEAVSRCIPLIASYVARWRVSGSRVLQVVASVILEALYGEVAVKSALGSAAM